MSLFILGLFYVGYLGYTPAFTASRPTILGATILLGAVLTFSAGSTPWLADEARAATIKLVPRPTSS